MSIATALQGVSPFGPIFGKELRTTARRKRTYFLRVIYLGILLFVLLMVYINTYNGSRYAGVAMQNQQRSEMGQIFFACFGIFSVLVMGLLGPILTATAISSERLRKTLPVLLMTPITAWQIIAGKIFSRLLIAMTLLALGLPVLALVRLLGGVELEQMITVVSIAFVAVLSSAAIGLFLSTLMNRAHAIILLSYGAMLILYAFVPFVIAQLLRGTSNGNTALSLICGTNPYALGVTASMPPAVTRMLVRLPWEWCIGLHLGMTAVLLLLSASILRWHARRANTAPIKASDVEFSAPPSSGPAPLPAAALAGELTLPAPQPAVAPRPKVARQTRFVTDNPILWREIRRPLMRSKWQRIVGVLLCIALLLIVYSVMEHRSLAEPQDQAGWAWVFNFLFSALIIVISATAIAQEKESDTWNLLMTAPISGGTVVWGKAIGVMRRMLWPLVFIAAHFLLFACCGVIPFMTVFAALWVIVTFNTVWVATGVYFSLRFEKVTVAVVSNLSLVISIFLVALVVAALAAALDTLKRNIGGPYWGAVYWSAFSLAAAFWLLKLVQTILRPRGALGQLMVATVLLIAAVLLMIGWQNRNTDSGSEMVAWYAPYAYLILIWQNWNSEFKLPNPSDPPNPIHFRGAGEVLPLLFFVGAIHLLLATAILTLTGAKFSGLVGRAPQIRRLTPQELSRGVR